MEKINELIEKLYIGDYGENIVNYADGYICDIITEIADSNVDIYCADLLDWVRDNSEYVERAINEGFVDLKSPDFFQMLRSGQYIQIEEELYENIDDIIKYYIYNYIKDMGIEEVSEEQLEEIEFCDFDYNSDLEDINNELERIFEKEEDENVE